MYASCSVSRVQQFEIERREQETIRGCTTPPANSTRKRARARVTIAASPRCENCGSIEDLTCDHIISVIDGGASGPLRILCRNCNSPRG